MSYETLGTIVEAIAGLQVYGFIVGLLLAGIVNAIIRSRRRVGR